MSVTIIRPAQEHRAAWNELYTGYAAFYGVDQTDEMRDRVWGWIHDDSRETEGLMALDSTGTPVGLAHFRPFARPLSATYGGFLDDLFVSPAARGSGAARALIVAVADVGRQRGWSVIRWITNDTNFRARSLYQQVAKQTPWITYDIGLQ